MHLGADSMGIMPYAQPARRLDASTPPPGPRVPMRFWSATRWLIIVNIGVFVLDLLTGGRLTQAGLFSVALAVKHLQLWRWITFQFLHAGPVHLLFNMLFLYFFGPMVEARLGKPRFTAFYLICGLAGAASYMLLWRLGILIYHAEPGMVGASAGIFGLAAAGAVIDPYYPVRLFWPPITLTLRTMVLFYIGFAVLMVWTGGANAGGEAAHLGGAAAGFLLIRNPSWLARLPFRSRRRTKFWKPGDPAENFFRRDA
jgi:membrane associated rhomboid family serine protease